MPPTRSPAAAGRGASPGRLTIHFLGVAEIRTIFEPWQLAECLETARQTEPFDPSIYDQEDDIELERQLDLRRSAADLLLVERAEEWLLGN